MDVGNWGQGYSGSVVLLINKGEISDKLLPLSSRKQHRLFYFV